MAATMPGMAARRGSRVVVDGKCISIAINSRAAVCDYPWWSCRASMGGIHPWTLVAFRRCAWLIPQHLKNNRITESILAIGRLHRV